jgi:hypothetical protein
MPARCRRKPTPPLIEQGLAVWFACSIGGKVETRMVGELDLSMSPVQRQRRMERLLDDAYHPNNDVLRALARRRLDRHFGIKLDDLNALLDAQGAV